MQRCGDDELRALDHHQRWREDGLPTVSVLEGDRTALNEAWTAWLGRRGFVGWSPPHEEARVERAWLRQLAQSSMARDALIGLIAGVTGKSPAALARQTPLERRLSLDAAPLTAQQARLCRWYFEADTTTTPPVDALVTWLPLMSPPPALLIGSTSDAASLITATQLAESLPALPIALLVGPKLTWPSDLPPRLRALLERGRFALAAATHEQAAALAATVATASLKSSLETLVQLGAASSTLIALAACEREVAALGDAAPQDELAREDAATVAGVALGQDRPRAEAARSAVEGLMSRVLELHPELRGRFALNRPVACDFAHGEAEVDFLDERLRVALEIDGWHHFRDEDAYRRDRRKDLALQRAGYLVVRVLASDVTRRLEDVLRQLTEVVSFALQRHVERDYAPRS